MTGGCVSADTTICDDLTCAFDLQCPREPTAVSCCCYTDCIRLVVWLRLQIRAVRGNDIIISQKSRYVFVHENIGAADFPALGQVSKKYRFSFSLAEKMKNLCRFTETQKFHRKCRPVLQLCWMYWYWGAFQILVIGDNLTCMGTAD